MKWSLAFMICSLMGLAIAAHLEKPQPDPDIVVYGRGHCVHVKVYGKKGELLLDAGCQSTLESPISRQLMYSNDAQGKTSYQVSLEFYD